MFHTCMHLFFVLKRGKKEVQRNQRQHTNAIDRRCARQHENKLPAHAQVNDNYLCKTHVPISRLMRSIFFTLPIDEEKSSA